MAENEDRTKKAADLISKGMVLLGTPGMDDDKGDSVMQKDPDVELRRELAKIGLAIPPYGDLIVQLTSLDHPIQAMSVIKDLTELDVMRSLGLDESIYNTLRGTSFVDPTGKIHISPTGFMGHMRARQALLYPGLEGMEFHPREQVFRSNRSQKDNTKKSLSWWKRVTGGGED